MKKNYKIKKARVYMKKHIICISIEIYKKRKKKQRKIKRKVKVKKMKLHQMKMMMKIGNHMKVVNLNQLRLMKKLYTP